jgi:hypothetical protein
VDTGTNVNNRDINILQSKAEHIEYPSSAISRYHTAPGFPGGLRYYAGQIVAANWSQEQHSFSYQYQKHESWIRLVYCCENCARNCGELIRAVSQLI